MTRPGLSPFENPFSGVFPAKDFGKTFDRLIVLFSKL